MKKSVLNNENSKTEQATFTKLPVSNPSWIDNVVDRITTINIIIHRAYFDALSFKVEHESYRWFIVYEP